MNQRKHFTILIAGAGGIGRAVGLLLAEWSDFDSTIYIGDRETDAAREAARWLNDAHGNAVVRPFALDAVSPSPEFLSICEEADILLDCLPGSLAPALGRLARHYEMHYVNLTEYVAETEELQRLGAGASTGFVLQTGLAPGFVNVLACHLINEFERNYRFDKLEYVGMKVGALSDYAGWPSYYGVTWSPVGVATEYLKPAVVVRDFRKITVPSLSESRSILIDGRLYEESFTSGGAADLPDTLAGRVRHLDYKTLRHPGHYDWVKDRLREYTGENKIAWLQQQLMQHVPVMEQDRVVVYVTVRGFDKGGVLRSLDKSYNIPPVKVGRYTLRAIQATTAAPMAECAYMLLTGNRKGVILQSHLDAEEFLNGRFVKAVYQQQGAVVQSLDRPASASARIF